MEEPKMSIDHNDYMKYESSDDEEWLFDPFKNSYNMMKLYFIKHYS
jgi:hypothetical protein